MKATGIVRRIDDLGRVVIPKEIRRTMRIREGDPLEIYTSNEGEVIFKKYSPINELSGGAVQAADVVHKLTSAPVVIFDRDHVVAVAGVAKKEFNERRVSAGLEDILENKKNYLYTSSEDQKIMPVEGISKHALSISPILSSGDLAGAVVIIGEKSDDIAKESYEVITETIALLLGKQIEQ